MHNESLHIYPFLFSFIIEQMQAFIHLYYREFIFMHHHLDYAWHIAHVVRWQNVLLLHNLHGLWRALDNLFLIHIRHDVSDMKYSCTDNWLILYKDEVLCEVFVFKNNIWLNMRIRNQHYL